MPQFIYDIIPPGVRRGMAVAAREVSKWIKFLRLFLKTSKYGIPLLVIGIIGFGALLAFALYPEREVLEIFPTKYEIEVSEEIASGSQEYNISWQNGEKALLKSLDKDADLAEFFSENSAILFAGEEVRITEGRLISVSLDIEDLTESASPSVPVDDLEISESVSDEELATESEGFEEELIEEVEVIATESEEIIEEEVGVIATESDKIESDEIPEGIGGCEFCDEEEIASDAEDLLNLLEEVEEMLSISQPPLIKQSIIFSGFDFDVSDSVDSFKKVKLNFSFAAVEGSEEDVLLVEYRAIKEEISSKSMSGDLVDEGEGQVATSSESLVEDIQSDSIIIEDLIDSVEDLSEWKTLKLIKLDEEQSNFINGGYWQTGGLNITFWEDLSNIEVRFTVQSIDPENRLPIYLDAIWLSIEYSKPEEPKKPEEKEDLEDEYELELVSDKIDFKIDEDLEFKFHFGKKPKKNILLNLVSSKGNKDINVRIAIFDGSGRLFKKVNSQIQHKEGGEFIIRLVKLDFLKFQPGKYKLKIEVENKKGFFIGEQDFTWGVLAINTNKSIFLPGEQAYLQMAALKDDGHTICNANLRLEIDSPDGFFGYPEVEKSGFCGPNNVTDVPDYFAYYQVKGVGIYEMKLTNLDNGYKITDSFEVRDSVAFDIERIGPTRIYPPVSYVMVLRIEVNQNFVGNIIETIPSSFEVLDQEARIRNQEKEFIIQDSQFETQTDNNGEKKLIWPNIILQPGDEVEIKYTFNAPNISPYLYSLGPLEIRPIFDLAFGEAGQWQIAADQAPGDPPTINEVSLNSKQNIILIENSQIDIIASASITDPDGCADISGVKAIVYRYGSGNTASCSNDPNNCYDENQFECVVDGACVSNTQDYRCVASSSMYFFTDPTDAISSFSADEWVVSIIASDSVGQDVVSHSYDDNDESVVEVNTLVALEVTVGDSIQYNGGSSIIAGQDTGAVNEIVTIKNTGNRGIDVNLQGTDLTGACGTITVGNQQYASTSFTYDDYGTALTGSNVRYEGGSFSWWKPTDTTPAEDQDQETIYWGISVPYGVGAGSCSGTSTFSETED